MTGFAEKRFDSQTLSVKISIRTLNHRYFDWSFRGSQCRELEDNFRKICNKNLQRGRVEVFIELDFLDPRKLDVRVNEDVLVKILSSFQKISAKMGKDVRFNIENFFSLPQVVQLQKKKLKKEDVLFLEESFAATLAELIRGREREGRQLKKEIQKHLKNLRFVLRQMETLARNHPLLIQEKLLERLKELGHETPLSEEKMTSEAAYYAQRYDLSEEIARLKCHVDHFLELLSPGEKAPVGKNLDFLAQELFREANTVNSKAQDMVIVKLGLKIKGEVDSIRQQVQNLE
jgi:uncharacterized protein (TIGR00255 family)